MSCRFSVRGERQAMSPLGARWPPRVGCATTPHFPPRPGLHRGGPVRLPSSAETVAALLLGRRHPRSRRRVVTELEERGALPEPRRGWGGRGRPAGAILPRWLPRPGREMAAALPVVGGGDVGPGLGVSRAFVRNCVGREWRPRRDTGAW